MKYYTYNGNTTKHLPDPLRLTDGGWISPMTEERFVAFGGVITEDEEPTHMDELEAAMQSFREVCYVIGQFIHDADFKGGINEIEKLYTSPYALENQQMAMMLAMRWQGADRQCNHFASKEDVGLDSPKWWYVCWELPIPDEVSVPEGAHEVEVGPDPVTENALNNNDNPQENNEVGNENSAEPSENEQETELVPQVDDENYTSEE